MKSEFFEIKKRVDDAIESAFSEKVLGESRLIEPMKYAVLAPGKRIRGVLTLSFCERLSVPEEQAMPFAVALEMIHAYSLVHDDLPEMDDDDFRRGLPTCHKKFDHATALLAGDGILNYAVEFLLSQKSKYQPEFFLNAMSVLFSASGALGMLNGQAIDKMGESRNLTFDELLELHRMKTGALLLAPIRIAEALSNKKAENYVNYCRRIGLAFQIRDDILDVEGNAQVLGKEVGKDALENKSTFTSILGVPEAKKYLEQELELAKCAVQDDPFLLWIAEYIGARNN
ncbi:MAG: polyprenyl synthetase family protein [Clostridia bacterium]|nr:polyprenyl synthetase family protein [Clostridia bacterium]